MKIERSKKDQFLISLEKLVNKYADDVVPGDIVGILEFMKLEFYQALKIRMEKGL